MKTDIISFFTLQRRIFGVCPGCHDFFRLSDCKTFLKKKPLYDWKEKIDLESQRLDRREERLNQSEKEIRERAQKKGRRLAQLAVRRIDPIFTPRKLDPDDAKVILHPIDYVVFNGMNTATSIKNIVLLDREAKQPGHQKIQKSIERVIDQENYEWQTLRVRKDGKIEAE